MQKERRTSKWVWTVQPTKTERNQNSEAGNKKRKVSEERAESGGEMKGREKRHLSWVSRWMWEARWSWRDPRDRECRRERSHKAENAKLLSIGRGGAKRHRCSGRRSSRRSCRRSSFAIIAQRKKRTNPERDCIAVRESSAKTTVPWGRDFYFATIQEREREQMGGEWRREHDGWN